MKKKLKLNSATDNKAKRTFTNDCVVEFVCEKVVQFGGAINGESHSDINVMRRKYNRTFTRNKMALSPSYNPVYFYQIIVLHFLDILY